LIGSNRPLAQLSDSNTKP